MSLKSYFIHLNPLTTFDYLKIIFTLSENIIYLDADWILRRKNPLSF